MTTSDIYHHLDNFVFVITHSTHFWWSVGIFTFLGFWLGYLTWARYAKEVRLLSAVNQAESPDTNIKEDDRSIEELATAYEKPTIEPDDLTNLDGINKTIEARLNKAGIYTIAQLKDLDKTERADLETELNLPKFDWNRWEEELNWMGISSTKNKPKISVKDIASRSKN